MYLCIFTISLTELRIKFRSPVEGPSSGCFVGFLIVGLVGSDGPFPRWHTLVPLV